MVDGTTQADRVKGAAMTATAAGTLQTSVAAALGGATQVAARANVVGAAAISGIEGVHQLATADTTSGKVAGGLKTAAAAALAASAVPGPHSVPLAVAGAGMYVGGMVADNWDTVSAVGEQALGWAGDVASDAYEGVSSRVGSIVDGIAGWFS